MHSTDSIRRGGDPGRPVRRRGGMPVAGEGAPLVAEFAVTEFAAALGMSTDAGKRYVGHALELRHRLPRVWKRVQSGGLRPWLAPADRRDGPCSSPRTPRRSWTGTSRRPRTRIGPGPAGPTGRRGDRPLHARPKPRPVASSRRTAATSRSSPSRSTPTTAPLAVHGELDLADALDLETAIQTVAAQLKDLGSEDSLDVRRSHGGRRARPPPTGLRLSDPTVGRARRDQPTHPTARSSCTSTSPRTPSTARRSNRATS